MNPFLNPKPTAAADRAHSKYSASGSERWLDCAASVALEESMPPTPGTPWSMEGTFGHAQCESLLNGTGWVPNPMDVKDLRREHETHPRSRSTIEGLRLTGEMKAAVTKCVQYVNDLHARVGGKLFIEKRIYMTFLHPEMFGTCDVIIAVVGDVLHIIDFKFGKGHVVDPKENTQMIQYALGVAESYNWNFKTVVMHILQPRAGVGSWFKTWTVTIAELKKWVFIFERGVQRVEANKSKPFPGGHCHWCKAKSKCPAKQEAGVQKIVDIFSTKPIKGDKANGIQKESESFEGFEEEFEKDEEVFGPQDFF